MQASRRGFPGHFQHFLLKIAFGAWTLYKRKYQSSYTQRLWTKTCVFLYVFIMPSLAKMWSDEDSEACVCVYTSVTITKISIRSGQKRAPCLSTSIYTDSMSWLTVRSRNLHFEQFSVDRNTFITRLQHNKFTARSLWTNRLTLANIVDTMHTAPYSMYLYLAWEKEIRKKKPTNNTIYNMRNFETTTTLFI